MVLLSKWFYTSINIASCYNVFPAIIYLTLRRLAFFVVLWFSYDTWILPFCFMRIRCIAFTNIIWLFSAVYIYSCCFFRGFLFPQQWSVASWDGWASVSSFPVRPTLSSIIFNTAVTALLYLLKFPYLVCPFVNEIPFDVYWWSCFKAWKKGLELVTRRLWSLCCPNINKTLHIGGKEKYSELAMFFCFFDVL